MSRDTDLEELLLKESLVSVTGLHANAIQVGIKGDPSLRETTFDRQRYCSAMDNFFDELKPHLQELLLNCSTTRLYIGFNNGEIRTTSIFDPLREEIHEAQKLLDDSYMERHFPPVRFEEKARLIRSIHDYLEHSDFYRSVPLHWKNILTRRNHHWRPMGEEHIKSIIQTLYKLREIEQYYLRNVTICIVQDVVRMQFNCDGTQIINAENFKQFLQENLV